MLNADMKAAGKFLLRHWPSSAFITFLLIVIMRPYTMERFFVYYPIKEVSGDPSLLGVKYSELALVTEDNVKLHGWFVPLENASVTLMVFHGNAGNIGHRVSWIGMLRDAGASVCIIDYRGYGKSEGQPFEKGLYRDADAAYQWWMKERSSTGEKLVLFGESLGGCVAIDLAARVPVAGLILQSAFTSAWDMAKTILPIGLLQPVSGVHFRSDSKISKVMVPKLFLHGNQDEIVPFRLGKKLFDLAPGSKEFYEVAGAGHNDLPWVAGQEYSRRISKFLAQIQR